MRGDRILSHAVPARQFLSAGEHVVVDWRAFKSPSRRTFHFGSCNGLSPPLAEHEPQSKIKNRSENKTMRDGRVASWRFVSFFFLGKSRSRTRTISRPLGNPTEGGLEATDFGMKSLVQRVTTGSTAAWCSTGRQQDKTLERTRVWRRVVVSWSSSMTFEVADSFASPAKARGLTGQNEQLCVQEMRKYQYLTRRCPCRVTRVALWPYLVVYEPFNRICNHCEGSTVRVDPF